ncbi:hypothetical protein LEP1GSC133_3616 [Leptospira borgpetersenii serovar Pomona str. 200901868]|uniref:Uncharacterized protein n=1 Tax=Leptospira borgpetersenii serovar Pomona str. 200901868 TaxID=1192866 RepID=M6W497_LEPBO|nr:hypothetical protein LEP1GSC133_3616 [Leptospira borgpetersenii serovar Pomona str. 200901868]
MQFTETKKQTALAKRTAFRRKAYCPPSSVVCPLNTEPFVTVLTLGMGNETMNGTLAEGNYELVKFRDSNKAQRHVNELGMRTGAEMYANDAVLDKVVTTTLAVTGIVGAILTLLRLLRSELA